ncbi:MAG: 1-acyl-sn-glycerol-3-phosphate acyltransferase [Bacteroidota bacterium]|nr:1-acyl-sn-glycerol-3-phosphate acyltransferase [Bacteroidota bacterium]
MIIVYWLIKPFALIFMRVYYKLYYTGLENVPSGVPVVFAPNHVNAFVDPVITAMNPSQKVRFFARGDVFKTPVARFILNQMNVSPMYRIQEGYAELKKNDKTFEECRQLLSSNKSILLFPEGICIQERRLRPLKKGLARIVFQTAESFDFSKDILVIPIGLNYTDAKRFRSKVFIDYGKPVSVKEYQQRYLQDKVKTINDFTRIFEAKMKEQMVIIEDPQNDELVTGIEEVFLNSWIEKSAGGELPMDQQYQATREIAEMVNHLGEHQPEMIVRMKELMLPYLAKLNKHQLRDHLLRPEIINKMNFATFLLEYVKVYLGMPIYLIGLAMNYPPYYLAKSFSDEKIKNVEFYASVYANLAMILWLVYYGIQLLFVAFRYQNWLLLGIYACLVPLTGLFVLGFYPMMKKIFGRWRLLRMVRKERHIVEELATERAVVTDAIERARSVYQNAPAK